jgi:hypothetical protein
MFQNVSDQNLLNKVKEYRSKEKYYTSKILEHLQEIENRKVYCDLGYSSLFRYCLEELTYSEAEASVRVNAIRLIKAVPSVKSKIDQGELKLSQAAQVQRFFNENKSVNKKKVIAEVCGKTFRETKKILDEKSGRVRTKSITLNERLLKKLEFVMDDFDCEELEAIEALLDAHIERKKSEKLHRVERGSKKQRYISRKVKEAVYVSAHGRCEFVSSQGKRCSCRTNLQYDHIKPVAYGGKSTTENLRLLCFNHNQRAWIKNHSG